MAYLVIITNKQTKEEKQIYCFNYDELINLLVKLDIEICHIQIKEVTNVYNMDSFLNTQLELIIDDIDQNNNGFFELN